MPEPELVDRVSASTGLSPGEAARVIDDVLAWHRESVADYVRRRHRVRNAEAFTRISAELASRLVAAPSLSERQLRRLIYG